VLLVLRTCSEMCRYIRMKKTWELLGSLQHSCWGKPQRTTWLSEKPSRRKGLWGIGCVFCAHLVEHLAQHPVERKRLSRTQLFGALCFFRPLFTESHSIIFVRLGSRTTTKWGTFQISSRLRSRSMKLFHLCSCLLAQALHAGSLHSPAFHDHSASHSCEPLSSTRPTCL